MAHNMAQEVALIELPYAQQSWYTIKRGIVGLSPQPSSHAPSCLTPLLEDISILSLVKVDLPKDGPLCLNSQCSWIVKIV